MDFYEWLEDVGALLGSDATAGVRHVELNLVLAALLEVEGNLALGGRIFCGVAEQVRQYMRDVGTVEPGTHLWCVDHQLYFLLHLATNLVHHVLAELLQLYVLHLHLCVGILQV